MDIYIHVVQLVTQAKEREQEKLTSTRIELRISVWKSSALTTEPRLPGRSQLPHSPSYTTRWYSNAGVSHLTYLTLHSFKPCFSDRHLSMVIAQAYNLCMLDALLQLASKEVLVITPCRRSGLGGASSAKECKILLSPGAGLVAPLNFLTRSGVEG